MTRFRMFAAIAVVGAAAGSLTVPGPAQAAFGDQVFFFNSAGGYCLGQPVSNGTCTFHSTGHIGYGGYGPYTVTATKNGVVVYQKTCPFGTDCGPQADAPADADYVLKLDPGFGSLSGGTTD
jgi:hypothetical protein